MTRSPKLNHLRQLWQEQLRLREQAPVRRSPAFREALLRQPGPTKRLEL